MGMAITETYPVPRVRKRGYMWRVTWADVSNYVYYRDFPTWEQAMEFTK